MQSKTDIGSLERLDIIDSLTNDGNAMLLPNIDHALQTRNQALLVSRCRAPNYSQILNDAIEFILVRQAVASDNWLAILILFFLFDYVTDEVGKFLGVHSVVVSVFIKFGKCEDSCIDGHSFGSVQIIAANQSKLNARERSVPKSILKVSPERVFKCHESKESLVADIEELETFLSLEVLGSFLQLLESIQLHVCN